MDSLKSLMDKKQYEMVIKLTDETKDTESLFYRISAFTALNKIDEALNTIKMNKEILSKRMALLVKIHLDLLLALDRVEEAKEELKSYEEYPYFSQEVEEAFIYYRNAINEAEHKVPETRVYSDEEIIKNLESVDSEYVLYGLEMLQDRDIRKFLPYVQKIMSNFPRLSVRSYALMTLVEKKVFGKFNFLGVSGDRIVNPCTIVEPFDDDDFKLMVAKMENEIKDPVFKQAFQSILSTIAIAIYPDTIGKNVELTYAAISELASEYLKLDDQETLEEKADKLGINYFDIVDEIERLKDIMSNF